MMYTQSFILYRGDPYSLHPVVFVATLLEHNGVHENVSSVAGQNQIVWRSCFWSKTAQEHAWVVS